MAESTQFGNYVPTTQIWDIQALQALSIDPQLKELLVRLYQNLNLMATSLNNKESSYYNVTEFVNGQLFFPNPALSATTAQTPTFRQVFRKIINFGTLPNTATTMVAHNIPFNTPAGASTYSITRLYGAASDQTGLNYIPLPYASPILANNIELRADGTNIIITTGSNRTNFTICYVVIEYLKS